MHAKAKMRAKRLTKGKQSNNQSLVQPDMAIPSRVVILSRGARAPRRRLATAEAFVVPPM
jgi:hypothetical protein